MYYVKIKTELEHVKKVNKF